VCALSFIEHINRNGSGSHDALERGIFKKRLGWFGLALLLIEALIHEPEANHTKPGLYLSEFTGNKRSVAVPEARSPTADPCAHATGFISPM
jgi:hypothetical protein